MAVTLRFYSDESSYIKLEDENNQFNYTDWKRKCGGKATFLVWREVSKCRGKGNYLSWKKVVSREIREQILSLETVISSVVR